MGKRLQGFGWKCKNWAAQLRAAQVLLGARFGHMMGCATFYGELHIKHFRDGKLLHDYGVVGRRVVTTAGVNYLVDDWDDSTTDITNINFHDSGTGVVAENVADVGLGTPAGPARVAGTKSQPSANVLRSIATIAYTATLAITEHGIFSASTGVTLWDRTVFAAINVVNGDSIQFTYDCTVNAGG